MTAIPYGHRQFGVGHLRGGLPSELPGSFQQEENSPGSRMIGGETSAVGVHRRLARVVEVESSAADEVSTLSLFAEANVFDLVDDRKGKAVVDFRDVDVLGVMPACPNTRGASLEMPNLVMSGRWVIELGESGWASPNPPM